MNDCKHPRVQTFRFTDGSPAPLWSCVDCARKFGPIDLAMEKDAERGRWLIEWLKRQGLLHALFCRPAADALTGDYWILQDAAMISSGSCEGYGKTEDDAIDAAMAKESL